MSQTNEQNVQERVENHPPADVELQQRLPPNLLRIYADNSDKKTMVAYWVIFFSALFLIALVSLAIPDAFVLKNNLTELNVTDPLLNPKVSSDNFSLVLQKYDLKSNPNIGLVLRRLQLLNQFAVIMIKFIVIDTAKNIDIKQNITISYYALDVKNINSSTGDLVVGKNFYKDTIGFSINSDSAIKIVKDKNTVIGYTTYVGYFRDIEPRNYLINIKFQNTTALANIKQMSLQATLINPKFTIFTILIRAFFFISSLIFAIGYWYRYKKLPPSERTIEQRLISVLSILLVLFNDPLYGATFLKPNGFLSFYSVFVVVNFLIFLLFHWIIFFERILYENGIKDTQLMNWKKFLYIGFIYILTLVLYLLFAFYHFQEKPIIPSYDLVTGKLLAFQIFTVIVILLGFVYIITLYIRSICAISQRLWRNQLYMYFSIFFLVVIIGVFLYDGFHIFIYAGRVVFLLFSSMNMYVYYMQLMYSVTTEEIKKIQNGNSYIYNRQEAASIVSDMDFGSVNLQFKQNNIPNRIAYKNQEDNHLYQNKQVKEEAQKYNQFDLDYDDENQEPKEVEKKNQNDFGKAQFLQDD